MPIIQPCIRPPGEANSILLQVTTGCSSNSCTFCGAYNSKPFSIKPLTEIFLDIHEYAKTESHTKQLFLMDGDALAINNAKLLPILEKINECLPIVNRISSYANGFNITAKTTHELRQLYDKKLKVIYLGLESGSQQILDNCKKKSTVVEMIDAVKKADEVGIKSSVMVLLGLGGKELSDLHIEKTAAALNAMQPAYLSFLSLMVIPQTPLAMQIKNKEFTPLNSKETLWETLQILRQLKLRRTQFFANHASNYLPLSGRLPESQEKMIALLEMAVAGQLPTTPEFLRGL